VPEVSSSTFCATSFAEMKAREEGLVLSRKKLSFKRYSTTSGLIP
jgi:hypothetical protein